MEDTVVVESKRVTFYSGSDEKFLFVDNNIYIA
jgi:hypothetical protein